MAWRGAWQGGSSGVHERLWRVLLWVLLCGCLNAVAGAWLLLWVQVKEILVEESNVQPVNSPVTVGGHGTAGVWGEVEGKAAGQQPSHGRGGCVGARCWRAAHLTPHRPGGRGD